jgi:hypothetical protein
MDRLGEWFLNEGERKLAELFWSCFKELKERNEVDAIQSKRGGDRTKIGQFIYTNELGTIECDIVTFIHDFEYTNSWEWVCRMTCGKKTVFDWRVHCAKNFIETKVNINLFAISSRNHPVPQTDDFWVRLLTARFNFQPNIPSIKQPQLSREANLLCLPELESHVTKPKTKPKTKNLLYECWRRYTATCSNCGWNQENSQPMKDVWYYPFSERTSQRFLTQHIDLWLRMDQFSDNLFEPKRDIFDYNRGRYPLKRNRTYVTGFRQVIVYYNHQRHMTFFMIAKRKQNRIVDTYTIIGNYNPKNENSVYFVPVEMSQGYDGLFYAGRFDYPLLCTFFAKKELEEETRHRPHIRVEFVDNRCTPKRQSVVCSYHDNVAYKLMQDLDFQIPLDPHIKQILVALMYSFLSNVPKELVNIIIDYCPGYIKDADQYGPDTWILSESSAERQTRYDQHYEKLKKEQEDRQRQKTNKNRRNEDALGLTIFD